MKIPYFLQNPSIVQVVTFHLYKELVSLMTKVRSPEKIGQLENACN